MVSSSKGIYAISLQGSNKLYLALLLKIFCRAPTYTAASSGVIPKPAIMGVNGWPKRIREKNPTPVRSKTVGVIMAATPHPYLLSITLLSNIIAKVAIPVAVEKSPMKDEYSFGLGNYHKIKKLNVKKKDIHISM